MAQAPICEGIGVFAIGQGVAPSVPSIPMANDLASALAAISAIRAHLQSPPQIAKPQTPQQAQQSGGVRVKNPKKKSTTEGDWEEDRSARVTETNVRIENPDDPEQFVLVVRINRLVFVNGKTKETIVWNRD